MLLPCLLIGGDGTGTLCVCICVGAGGCGVGVVFFRPRRVYQPFRLASRCRTGTLLDTSTIDATGGEKVPLIVIPGRREDEHCNARTVVPNGRVHQDKDNNNNKEMGWSSRQHSQQSQQLPSSHAIKQEEGLLVPFFECHPVNSHKQGSDIINNRHVSIGTPRLGTQTTK